MEIKLTHGQRGNEILSIEVVESGLACNCICPACGSILVAKKGKEIAHHFAHYNKHECEYQAETELHYQAKLIFERSKHIVLPEFYSENEIDISVRDKVFEFDSVVSERRLGSIIPDIILYKGDRMLMVEIAVTHFVDEIKQQKIDELKIPVIEIDLCGLDRNTTEQDLVEAVLTLTFNKEWKYNEKANVLFQRVGEERKRREREASEKQERLDKESARAHQIRMEEREKREVYFSTKLKEVVKIESKSNQFGFIFKVSGCPLKKRIFNGDSYANAHVDCRNCNFFRGFRESKTKIICLKKEG